ncbi:hypothetical protein KY312_03555, partial [Candidatus Woesearchaeota archaeon]|nr:hypothetical protein [Candidatus Woesearchaeota archaeon]
MGIFNWLGKVFPKKEQIEILVPFNDLEDWVDDNTEKIVSDNKVKVNEKFNEVLENKDELNQLLVNLKNAKLHNPNIEPRMLQFMSGNRDNYINQINFFVSNFPTMDDDFFAKFQDALNDLSKRTTRSYQILQEFFSDETRRIALKLREIDELSKSVHGLKTSGQMQKISEIKEKIKEIDNSKSTNEDVIERLDIVETKLNENKMRQEFLQDKIDEKKKSEEYDKYTKLIEKRETLSSEL